jgi:hypothetical protein
MRLGAPNTPGLPSRLILSLEPERLQNPMEHRRMIPDDEADSMPETLKLLALLVVRRRNVLSPLFQTIKVVVAIFRAKVRRAIAGLIPLASKAA